MATVMTKHLQELTGVLKDLTVGRSSYQQILNYQPSQGSGVLQKFNSSAIQEIRRIL